MKDSVDRVLAGLGKVEAPAGMEGRVLRRLEARAGWTGAWAWGTGFVAAMVLVVVIMRWDSGRKIAVEGSEVARRGHTPGAEARVVGGPERPKAEALGYLEARANADSSASLQNDKQALLRNDKHALLRDDKRGSAAPAHVSEARHGAPAPAAPAPGLVARMESFPAPPEPLTEQERRLRRIALSGSEPAFELLNEETREAAMAASDAEFEAFVRSGPSGGRPDGRTAGNLDLQR